MAKSLAKQTNPGAVIERRLTSSTRGLGYWAALDAQRKTWQQSPTQVWTAEHQEIWKAEREKRRVAQIQSLRQQMINSGQIITTEEVS